MVVDTGNNRVLHFSGSGSTADRVYGQSGDFTTPGCATGFNQPAGLAIDPTGGLYVADTGNGRVLQVDWYEADVDLDDERVGPGVRDAQHGQWGSLSSGLPASDAAGVPGSPRVGISLSGGTFRRLRYDNLGSAVKKIRRGFRREETARFVAFRSHWNFEASFCTPGEGHEKGGVEGEVGTFRRNHLVPVPAARDLEDLNAMPLTGCREDEARRIDGRAQTVGEALAIERQHLLPLAREGFDLVEVSFGKVNGLGCIKARTNAYSTPLAPGTKAQIRLTATTVEVWYKGRCVARHARCYGRYQHVLDLEHYPDVLEHKPGAFAGSKPLEQWRRAGRWPTSYDQFWTGLMQRHGRQDGTRAMIELLQLGRRLGAARLRSAIESAPRLGCADSAAVQHLMATDGLVHQRPSLLLEVGSLLRQYERPLPEMHVYDHQVGRPPHLRQKVRSRRNPRSFTSPGLSKFGGRIRMPHSRAGPPTRPAEGWSPRLWKLAGGARGLRQPRRRPRRRMRA